MTVSRLVIITLVVSSLASVPARQTSPQPSLVQSDSQAVLREIGDRFCVALVRKDLDALVALWSSTSPALGDFKQQMRQLFSAYDGITVRNIALSDIVVQGGGATARLRFDIEAADSRTGKPASGLGRQIETVTFVKEGEAFKIRSYGPAAGELAASLIVAKTERDRAGLLSAEPELVTVELRRQLLSQGMRFRLKGDYAKAMSAYEIARSISEQIGDEEGGAWALANMGVVYIGRADYGRAKEVLEQSLTVQRRLGNQAGILFSLKYIGDAERFQSQFKDALEVYQKCLELADTTGNRQVKAYVLGGIGGIQAQQGEYDRALEYYKESLAVQEATGDKPGIASALASMGYVNGALGNYEAAREFLRRSLSMCESMGDKSGASYALINLGANYFSQGDYARALENYERSLEINQSLGNKSGIATALNNIGIIYRMQGNYPQALEYYEQSLRLSQETGGKAGTARVLNSIGNVFFEKGEYSVAIDYFKRSLTIYEELGDRAGIPTELDNIGCALGWQQDYSRAEEYLNRSLALTKSGNLRAGQARSLAHLAFVSRAEGKYTEALALGESSAAIATQIGSAETALAARLTAARALLELNRPDDARRDFDESIAAIETMRSTVAGTEEERERFFEGNLYPYQAMVGLLVSQGKAAEALNYAERAKGRVLLDVLTSGKVKINKAMTREEQERERRLTGELVSINTQIYQEQQQARPDPGRLDTLKGRLQKARLDREAFETGLYVVHPELRVKRGESMPAGLEEAGALIAETGVALLEYVVTEERTYVFALTRMAGAGSKSVTLEVRTIDISARELDRRVEQFRQTLANQNYAFGKPALELYQLLLKPVEAQLKGQSSVVIVPDTVLWNLPFQALQSAEGRFVIEDASISYAPSIGVLREMHRPHQGQDQAAVAGTLLAVGNPSPRRKVAPRGNAIPMDTQFGPLPEAEKQIRLLTELYGASRSRAYFGSEAREDIIKAESSKYRIIELATHGVLNDSSPMYSFVLLTKGDDDSSEDGFLEAWEIMDLNLNADLVVLSACETARGKVAAGEGVIGLSWALFVAGCPSAVVSQWKVESSGTTELMVDFHRNLIHGNMSDKGRLGRVDEQGTGLTKAEALRRAQLTLLKSKTYSHPFYWAPFVLMGDGLRAIGQ